MYVSVREKKKLKPTKSCCKSTRAKLPDDWDRFLAGKDEKCLTSPAGNRTPVSRVTGGDTYHYTTEDRYMLNTLAYSEILLLHKHWEGENHFKYSVFSLNATCSLLVIAVSLKLLKKANKIHCTPPRRGIEPRSPAWQAGILTTILPRIGTF